MGLLLGLNMLLWFAGFLTPVPCFMLSLRELIRRGKNPPAGVWRRRISQVSFMLLGLGLALWVYGVLRVWRGDYPYDALTASIGRWASPGLILVAAFAESPVRRYLLSGALGLFFFFAVSLGEIAI